VLFNGFSEIHPTKSSTCICDQIHFCVFQFCQKANFYNQINVLVILEKYAAGELFSLMTYANVVKGLSLYSGMFAIYLLKSA